MEQSLIEEQELVDGKRPGLATRYVTFQVGKLLFGVDVGKVQEIIRSQPMTRVPLAPSVVRGLVNLRGQIITAFDMRSLLGLQPFTHDSAPMNVVVQAGAEVVSLLVDGIGDVIDVDHHAFEATPETVPVHVSKIVQGVFKLQGQLLMILDTTSCMEEGESDRHRV